MLRLKVLAASLLGAVVFAVTPGGAVPLGPQGALPQAVDALNPIQTISHRKHPRRHVHVTKLRKHKWKRHSARRVAHHRKHKRRIIVAGGLYYPPVYYPRIHRRVFYYDPWCPPEVVIIKRRRIVYYVPY